MLVSLLLEKQHYHLIAVGVLGALACVAARTLPQLGSGQLWQIPTTIWFYATLANAVVHQVFVWLCWRLELHGQRLTRSFGRAAFPLYALLFALLILARPVLVTFTAVAGAQTIRGWALPMKLVSVFCALVAGYTMVSVKRYFGFKRAFGIDHFDANYRNVPFVKKGIFRFSSNAMYVYGFFALYVPGLWCQSSAALVAAALSHLYIWVHYFATERPDMRRIYEAPT
ncbi:MAG: hypothetical protein JRH20_23505 [Deltaproteobacteria bacterium]|nr:hypothetical protein [Deltaproteobacteria bacterium]